jgi:hypothetical protein
MAPEELVVKQFPEPVPREETTKLVVEAVPNIASAVEVAFWRMVEPQRVVEERLLERSDVSAPPTLSAEEMVDEPVTASEVEVAPAAESAARVEAPVTLSVPACEVLPKVMRFPPTLNAPFTVEEPVTERLVVVALSSVVLPRATNAPPTLNAPLTVEEPVTERLVVVELVND